MALGDQATRTTDPASGHSKHDDTLQPWRAYWPPTKGSSLEQRLKSQFPDLFTWHFEPGRLFDRPWRAWTNQSSGGGCTIATDKLDPVETFRSRDLNVGADQNSTCASKRRNRRGHKLKHSMTTETARRALDDTLQDRWMPSVQPDTFNYLAPLEEYCFEKPYKLQIPCIDGFQRTNLVTRSHPVTIFDLTGNEDMFTLADSGFHFTKCPIPMEEWTEASVSSTYLPSLVEWLQDYLDCEAVLIYAYNFRKNEPEVPRTADWKAPFSRVHCDATEKICLSRLRLYYPDEYERLVSNRIRFLNIWRPISTPVQDCPLAVCHYRTVDPEDLVPIDIVYPHFVDEAYEVLHSPKHRWFYKKGMEKDDAIILKLYDTLETEASVCPHAAFMDPSVPEGTPGRASIEVKVIAIG